MTAPVPNRPPRSAQGLAYGGLIPFVCLASASWWLGPAARALGLSVLQGYGATILGFLGAIHWGFAMRGVSDQATGLLVWGVIPSLVAALALLLTPAFGLGLIAAGLWVCYLVDRQVYPRFGLQGWLPMRLLLTVVSSLSCVAGATSQLLNA